MKHVWLGWYAPLRRICGAPVLVMQHAFHRCVNWRERSICGMARPTPHRPLGRAPRAVKCRKCAAILERWKRKTRVASARKAFRAVGG